MKKTFILAICAVSGIASANNLVVNGSFNLAGPSTPIVYTANSWDEISSSSAITGVYGWNQIGNDLAGIGIGYLGATNQEIDLSGGHDQGGTGMSQTVGTASGQEYALSFDVFTGGGTGNSGGVDAYIGLSEVGTNLQGGNNADPSLNRVLYTYDFTASGPTTLTFMDDHGNVSHIGNVSVQAVPEPSSLLGLGVPAFLVFRRRNKKNA